MSLHLNLHLLRVFYAVVQQQSFIKAAQALNISQPAVSKNVKELEHQLGSVLIDRAHKRNKITLTQAGQTLYHHAHSIFTLATAALDDLSALNGLTKGRLVIGASSTVANYILPPLLAEFHRAHPEIELVLQAGNTEQVCQALINYDIDLAYVEGYYQDSRLMFDEWQQDNLILIANNTAYAKDEINIEELSAATWLVREQGSGTRDYTDSIFKAQRLQSIRLVELGSNEAIVNAVAQGMGVALVPYSVAESLLSLHAIKTLTLAQHQWPVRDLFSVTFAGRPASEAMQAFSAMTKAN